MNERLLRRAEKEIRVGVKAIRDGYKTPKEAGLGKMLNAMKRLDEPLYDELMALYKKALQSPFCKRK
jgi:hypothetical protein